MQGEPRATHDIDIIICISELKAKKLVIEFCEPDFCLDEESIRTAIKKKGMFNLIDQKEGDKVDFWILTDNNFDQSRFDRRLTENFLGIEMSLSSPEDTILAKLRWADLCGGSEKQFNDALRVYEVQYEKLDQHYIKRMVKELDIVYLWKRLQKECDIID